MAANSGNGNVMQAGPLSVTGTTGIVAGTGNIQLANTGNKLAQAVSATGAQIGLADAGPLTLGTVDALSLIHISVGGNLAANSGNGNVTQDGPLSVTGTTGIVAGTGNIQLSNANNTLAQAVSASGAQIGLTDVGPLTLGTVDASGNLTLASTCLLYTSGAGKFERRSVGRHGDADPGGEFRFAECRYRHCRDGG